MVCSMSQVQEEAVRIYYRINRCYQTRDASHSTLRLGGGASGCADKVVLVLSRELLKRLYRVE